VLKNFCFRKITKIILLKNATDAMTTTAMHV